MVNVFVLSPFKNRAEIQNRLANGPSHVEMKSDQHTPDAAVAVGERVDGLELVMDKRGVDQVGNSEAILSLNVFLKFVQGCKRFLPRGRHKASIFDFISSDEVLMLFEFARLRVRATVRSDTAQKGSVRVAQRSQ